MQNNLVHGIFVIPTILFPPFLALACVLNLLSLPRFSHLPLACVHTSFLEGAPARGQSPGQTSTCLPKLNDSLAKGANKRARLINSNDAHSRRIQCAKAKLLELISQTCMQISCLSVRNNSRNYFDNPNSPNY